MLRDLGRGEEMVRDPGPFIFTIPRLEFPLRPDQFLKTKSEVPISKLASVPSEKDSANKLFIVLLGFSKVMNLIINSNFHGK